MTYEYTGLYPDTLEAARETDRIMRQLQMQMNFLDAKIEQQVLRIENTAPPYKNPRLRNG